MQWSRVEVVNIAPPPSPVVCGRLHLNRASGGRLARLWQRAENEEDHDGPQDWLPDWVLLPALSDTVQSIVRWIADMWNGRAPTVLNHIGDAKPPVSCIVLANLLHETEDIILVVLSMVFVALIVRRRRRRLKL